MTDEDATRRVRQLLLSGDNTVKNRTGPERLVRAHERYVEARSIAVSAGLDPSIIAIIDRRLTDVAASPAG